MGERVRVDTISETDVPEYRRAVEMSSERIRPWNPVNAGDLAYHLGRQSDEHRTFLIRALPEFRAREHTVVGKVNVTGITRGRAFNGVLGYDAYDPYAGRGLFADGLRLVVDLAFRAQPHGLGLNRVEAAVQPGNVRSAGLLRSLGFRRRGDYPRYLWLGDASGREEWRDHVVHGVDRAEWPPERYATHDHDRPVVVVTPTGRPPVDADVAAARALAIELGVPLLRERSGSWARCLDDAVTGAVLLADLDEARQEGIRAHDVVSATDLADPASITRVALEARFRAHG